MFRDWFSWKHWVSLSPSVIYLLLLFWGVSHFSLLLRRDFFKLSHPEAKKLEFIWREKIIEMVKVSFYCVTQGHCPSVWSARASRLYWTESCSKLGRLCFCVCVCVCVCGTSSTEGDNVAHLRFLPGFSPSCTLTLDCCCQVLPARLRPAGRLTLWAAPAFMPDPLERISIPSLQALSANVLVRKIFLSVIWKP